MTTTETITTTTGHTFEFTQADCDYLGKPRYIVHFMDLGLNTYTSTKETKQVNLKKYNGASYGGGFIFQSWNIEITAEKFVKLGLHSK